MRLLFKEFTLSALFYNSLNTDLEFISHTQVNDRGII